MIKFFRHIRKTMIKENRTSKYLLYAIGEIILVVIGILIALNINNWNEKNNRLQKEIALLYNVKNDLEADILNLKFQDSLFEKRETDSEAGIALFYTARTRKDIDSVFRLTNGLWNELYINQTTYNELVNSGSMYAITNKHLQKAINKYYSLVQAHIEYIRSVNIAQSELYELDPAIYPAKLLVAQLKKPRIDLKTIDTTWIGNPNSATYLSVNNYLNSNQESSNKYRREVFRRIITAANGLKAKINEELDSRL